MYSRSTLELFAAEYAKGASMHQISKATGIPRQTLIRWRKELGLPQRPAGGRPGKRERRER